MSSKGYKQTKEHIRKRITLERDKKISNTMKGKIPKNLDYLHSLPKTEKWKIKIREGRNGKMPKGEKCHFWKGGITPIKRQIRNSFRYRQWRSDIFTRDNFTCVLCGKRGGWIEADHYPKKFSDILKENNIKTVEQALLCEELWNINNGRTLCKDCHNKTK